MFFTVCDPASLRWLVFFPSLTHPVAQKEALPGRAANYLEAPPSVTDSVGAF